MDYRFRILFLSGYFRLRIGSAPAIEESGLLNRMRIGPVELSRYQSTTATGHAATKSDVVVVGISGSWHDSSAVLVQGGRLLGALEEERMTRSKHDRSQFPVNAILRLLQEAGLGWHDVDHLAVGWNYNQFVDAFPSRAPAVEFFERLHADYARARGIAVSEVARRDVLERNRARFQPVAVQDFLDRMARESNTEHRPHVSFVRHHWAHAASAWFASGFEESTLVVSIDGYGEIETTTVWLAKGGELHLLDSIPLPHSLGWVYSAVTEYLGFQPLNSEGEVMGLAPYGVPRNAEEAHLGKLLRDFMNEFVELRPRGSFRVDSEFIYFGSFPDGRQRVSQALIDRLAPLVPPAPTSGRRIDPEDPGQRKYAILAWALQQRIEEAVAHLVRHYLFSDLRSAGTRAVALAGGVALNIDVNSRLIVEGLVSPERLFIQPAAGDCGTALGAAMLVACEIYGSNPAFKMRTSGLGSEYSDRQIEATLRAFGLAEGADYELMADDNALVDRTADLLARGLAVGWFQGRCEFGPRALGNRSLLMKPADPRANSIANQSKLREPWRPSATSFTIEEARRVLEGMKGNADAPFMNLAFALKSGKADLLVSGRHAADGSTRPQTVSREQHPLFWDLLNRMGEYTGIAALVNTSLNRQEPLVESPEEALNTFAYMKELHALVIGHYVVTSRKRIVSSILALKEDTNARPLLEAAVKSGRVSDWEAVFTTACPPHPRARRIVAVLRDRWNQHRQLEWPLVKELCDGKNGEAMRDYLGAAIYNEAIAYGASELFVGSQDKYDPVVFDALAPRLRSFPRLAEFANFGDSVRIGRLADALQAPTRVCTAFEEFRPVRPPRTGWAIGVDVGAGTIKAAVLRDGEVWRSFTSPTLHSSGKSLHDQIVGMVERARAAMLAEGCGAADLAAIGVAVPGVVTMPSGECGEVHWLPNIESQWGCSSSEQRQSNYQAVNQIACSLRARFGAPVRMLNDAKAFGVAEAIQRFWREPKETIAVLAIGTGVGDVVLESGVIRFARTHQSSQAVLDTKRDSYGDASSGAPGTLSGYLSGARWKMLCRTAGVPDLESALASGDIDLYAPAEALIAQQSGHLAEWILNRHRVDRVSAVVLAGGRVVGRVGTRLASESNRILRNFGVSVEVELAAADPIYGGAVGAALFAVSSPMGMNAALAA